MLERAARLLVGDRPGRERRRHEDEQHELLAQHEVHERAGESGGAGARAGASVVMAVRNPAKGDEAAGRIRSVLPGAALEVAPLDLADLDSVREFAGRTAAAAGCSWEE